MYFQTEASKKFPEAKALASSILFLRFILPAVISPQKYRIWPGKFIPNIGILELTIHRGTSSAEIYYCSGARITIDC